MGFDRRTDATYRGPAMRWKLILGCVGTLALASPVYAQDTAATTEAPAADDAPGKSGGKRKDALTREQRAALRLGKIDASKVPLPEKKVGASKMISEQQAAQSRATDLLTEARAANDIIQLNCVNSKLTQIKGLLKLSQQASAAMYEGVERGTDDEINHQYTKIVVAHQKTMSLRAEAEQCVGEKSVYSGETKVDVEIDPSITQSDPTLPVLPPPGPAIPTAASEF